MKHFNADSKNVAMKRWSVKHFLKIEAMKRLMLHRLASLLHRFITVNIMCIHAKSSFNSAELSDTYVKAKTTKFFGFVTEIRKYNDFFKNWQSKSSLHRFFALLFFFVKALRQWRQNLGRDKTLIMAKNQKDEAMKRITLAKKLKRCNAGKEIEVMKRLMLHRIASSLHHFCCPALLLSQLELQWGGDRQRYENTLYLAGGSPRYHHSL